MHSRLRRHAPRRGTLRHLVGRILHLRHRRHLLLPADGRSGHLRRPALGAIPQGRRPEDLPRILRPADDAHHRNHGRLLRRQHGRDVDPHGGHHAQRRRNHIPPPLGGVARGHVEVSVRMLDGHRHRLPRHTDAQRRRAEPVARLRRPAHDGGRRQPALPEDRLPAHTHGIQLQDGDLPALHHRRRRQLRRAGPRIGPNIDGTGKRRFPGHIPHIPALRRLGGIRLGAPRDDPHRRAEPGRGARSSCAERTTTSVSSPTRPSRTWASPP